MKVRQRKKRVSPLWRLQEQIVQILEKVRTPGAVVRHNIFLPVIRSRSHRRCQCDVVISSPPPRARIIAIVEVQRRGRKININDFRGWVGKMREVGASQLVCVTERGFPRSVVEIAEDLGHKVRLMTLDTLKKNLVRPPVMIAPHLIQSDRKFQITRADPARVTPKLSLVGDSHVGIADPILTIDTDSAMLSMNEVMARVLNAARLPPERTLPGHEPFEVSVDFGQLGRPLWIHLQGQKAQILQWVVSATLSQPYTTVPMSMANVPYLEYGSATPTGWVSAVSYTRDEQVQHATLAVKEKDGKFTFALGVGGRDATVAEPSVGAGKIVVEDPVRPLPEPASDRGHEAEVGAGILDSGPGGIEH